MARLGLRHTLRAKLLDLPLARDAWRAARRLSSFVRLPRATVVYHPGYRAPENPFSDSRRAARILEYAMHEGCIHRHHVLRPARASIRQLNLVHPFSYLSQVAEPQHIERAFGQEVFELEAVEFIEQQRWMVGGTVSAARHALGLLGPRTVINLGGGLHHAETARGYGFCVFNDVAVAIAQLRKDGYNRRILVIDFDLHHGDGTRRIFAEDESVFTFSVHAEDWDDLPAIADMSVALGHGIGDEAYLRAVQEYLPRVFRRAKPHLVFYLAGVDVASDDTLGNWRVSADAILERDILVADAIGKHVRQGQSRPSNLCA